MKDLSKVHNKKRTEIKRHFYKDGKNPDTFFRKKVKFMFNVIYLLYPFLLQVSEMEIEIAEEKIIIIRSKYKKLKLILY